MQRRMVRTLGLLIFGGMLALPSVASAQVQIGGALGVNLDDTPIGTNFTGNVTLSPGTTTTLDQGEMTLTQTLVSAGPGSEWLVLDYEATGGKLLAGNLNGFWQLGNTVPLSTPAGFTGVFGYWSVNGVATSPIKPISGASGFVEDVGTDPLNASIPAYVDIFPSAIVSGTTSLPLSSLLFFSDYSFFLSSGGMNPNADNGFVIGLQITNSAAAVPEPSMLCLGAVGAVMAGGGVLIRRSRRPRSA